MRSRPAPNLKLFLAALALCVLSGCVGVEKQRLVSKPNMQFSRTSIYSDSSKIMPLIQPGLVKTGGAQPSTCTLCR